MRSLRAMLAARLIVHSVLLLFTTTRPVNCAAQTSTEAVPRVVPGSDAWREPARALAAKIASHAGPRAAILLSFKNNSALTPDDTAAVRRDLREELKEKGLRIVAAPPEPRRPTAVKGGTAEPDRVAVTLSENVRGYIWVAEIQRALADAGAAEVAMIAVPRPVDGGAPASAGLVIRRALLWQQDEPILDLAVVDASGASLLVLDPTRVSLVRFESSPAAGNGAPPHVDSAPLSHTTPWPRDPRGRIALDAGNAPPPAPGPEPAPGLRSGAASSRSFAAYLPGGKCQGTIEPRLTVDCSAANEAWPAGPGQDRSSFALGRNFFEGRVMRGGGGAIDVPAYFSAAELPGPAGSAGPASAVQVFDGVDGRVHVRARGREVAAFVGWGSNIAAIKADCANRWLLLADAASEWAEPDAVRAYEIDRGSAVAASPAVELAGPITALWPEGDATSVLAVSRDSRTGRYEAYSLSISCGQ